MKTLFLAISIGTLSWVWPLIQPTIMVEAGKLEYRYDDEVTRFDMEPCPICEKLGLESEVTAFSLGVTAIWFADGVDRNWHCFSCECTKGHSFHYDCRQGERDFEWMEQPAFPKLKRNVKPRLQDCPYTTELKPSDWEAIEALKDLGLWPIADTDSVVLKENDLEWN